MGRFDFQSPGAAASSEIQKFISEQAASRRQAMLDELNRQNMEKQWGFENRRLDQADAQEARAAQMGMEGLGLQTRNARLQEAQEERLRLGQETDDTRALGAFTPGGAEAGDIQSPALLKMLRDAGAMRKDPSVTPSVGSSYDIGGDVIEDPTITGSTIPEREVYVGDDAYQKEQRANALFEQLKQNTAFMADQGRAQTVEAAKAGINLSPSLAGPQGSYQILDEATGKLQNLGPANPRDQFGTRSRAPLGPASLVDVPKQAQIYKDGQWIKTDYVTRAQADAYGDAGYEVRTGNTPISGQRQGVSDSGANQIIITRRNLEGFRAAREGNNWNIIGMGPGPSADEVAAEAAYKAALGNVFAKDPSPPDVQQLVTFIATDPELSKLPSSAALQHPKLKEAYEVEGLTTADLQAIERLLNYSRGIVEVQ